MRTKSSNKNKISIVTLGCSKNLYDSEVLMGQLQASNKIVTPKADGNIIVINTCGFIENAKQESIDTILDFVDKKKNGQVDKVFVTGCLSERYKADLQKEIPEVDSYFGTTDLPLLIKALGADYKRELIGERMLTTPRHYAYLKISEGCDRACSFCAIPLMRGKHRSKSIEELVLEAKSLAAKGVIELILIAQDLTFYGLDLYKERRLADLLTALCAVEGIQWIRLHYAFPSGFPMEVLEVMRRESKICKYLDMPLQHISDPLLKSMRRGSTEASTTELIRNIRAEIPGIHLRTSLIVGYPGETEADFQKLMRWLEDAKIERVGCFTYSHEEGTHAYQLKDNVPQKTKISRQTEVMQLQAQISWHLNQEKVGKIFKCLIDRREGKYFVGRTEYDSPDVDNEVLIDASKHSLKVGRFYDLKIIEAADFDLFAIPAENSPAN